MYEWLDTALDNGLKEAEFWLLTPAELNRYLKSRERVRRIEAQEKASYDYLLADAIGKSVARIHSSTAVLPPIEEIYPTLFDSKEAAARKAEANAEISALRFRQFAAAHNKKFKGGNNSE